MIVNVSKTINKINMYCNNILMIFIEQIENKIITIKFMSHAIET